jgi:hypothetical protein
MQNAVVSSTSVLDIEARTSLIRREMMQFEFGPESGVWFWTMTVTRVGPLGGDTNGRVNNRGEAGRRIVEAYKRLLGPCVDDNQLPGHGIENRHGTQSLHGPEG